MNSKSPNQASFTYIVYFPWQKIYTKVEENPFHGKGPTVVVSASQCCALCWRCGERQLQGVGTSVLLFTYLCLEKYLFIYLFGHAGSSWWHTGSSLQDMGSSEPTAASNDSERVHAEWLQAPWVWMSDGYTVYELPLNIVAFTFW